MATRELQSILNSGELNSIYLGGTSAADSVVKQSSLDTKADIPYVALQSSDITTQEPSGLGVAKQVTFGPYATNSVMTLGADGTVTFSTAGHYHAEIRLQVGRTGATSTSLFLVRCLKNDVQYGGGSAFKLDDAEVLFPCVVTLHVDATIGTTLKFQIMRDPAGHNSGGLYMTDPSDGWNNIPSANITLTKIG